MKKPLTSRPGEFRARCRRPRWVPLADVLDTWSAAQRAEQQVDTEKSRWDSKMRCEVVEARCAFETTNPGELERHLRELHGGGKRYTVPSMRTRWHAPKLLPEGRPFETTKAIEKGLRTCAGCGLVAEVDFSNASRLWWSEHTSMCVGAQDGAA